jgi:hypothetical protein
MLRVAALRRRRFARSASARRASRSSCSGVGGLRVMSGGKTVFSSLHAYAKAPGPIRQCRLSSGVERIIGNDEVESSNLSGGTTKLLKNIILFFDMPIGPLRSGPAIKQHSSSALSCHDTAHLPEQTFLFFRHREGSPAISIVSQAHASPGEDTAQTLPDFIQKMSGAKELLRPPGPVIQKTG